MNDERYDDLVRKIDGLGVKLDQYMTGSHGTNGIFGRLQALEIAESNRKAALQKIWAALLAVGVAAAKALWN